MTRYCLSATASHTPAITTENLAIKNLPHVVHVHFDVRGRQFVVLKSSDFHITLIVAGALVTAAPFSITLGATRLADLDTQIRRLIALAHLVLGRRLTIPPDRPGQVERIKLRDAVIALDGERAGASRRQIASVIHGPARVAEDWTDPSGRLKAVTKRDVLRGRRLVSGGYRDLVSGGTNRTTG